MIDKKQLFSTDGEFGRTERVHLTVLTHTDKDTYMSNRFPQKDKLDAKMEIELEDWYEMIWRNANSKSILTFCVWDNDIQDYIGYCNYNELDENIAAIGIELIPAYQNKGFGYEICSLLLEKFFERTEDPFVHYRVQRSNKRSHHLVEKLGGQLLEVESISAELEEMNDRLPEGKRLDFRAMDIFTYAIYRPERQEQ